MTSSTLAANRPGRVMVVDDSALIRHLLAAQLRQAGHDVVEVPDGGQALLSFRRQACGLVITDMSMPGLGGLDLLAALRREKSRPEVILLTGTRGDDPEAAVQARRLGAHDYIAKTPSALDSVVLAAERALATWHGREKNEHPVPDDLGVPTPALTAAAEGRA